MDARLHATLQRHLVEGPASAARGLGRVYERIRGMDAQEFSEHGEELAGELVRLYVERGAAGFRSGVAEVGRALPRASGIQDALTGIEADYDRYNSHVIKARDSCLRADYGATLEALWAAQQGIARVRPRSERLLRMMDAQGPVEKPAWLAKYL